LLLNLVFADCVLQEPQYLATSIFTVDKVEIPTISTDAPANKNRRSFLICNCY